MVATTAGAHVYSLAKIVSFTPVGQAQKTQEILRVLVLSTPMRRADLTKDGESMLDSAAYICEKYIAREGSLLSLLVSMIPAQESARL